jgi:hypothetical protein
MKIHGFLEPIFSSPPGQFAAARWRTGEPTVDMGTYEIENVELASSPVWVANSGKQVSSPARHTL